jgi:hypothetical protein
VPAGTETANANIAAVQVFDVAGNSTLVGPYGPYEVDKKPPAITGLTLTVSNPTLGQADSAMYTCSDGGSGVVTCGPTGSLPFGAVPSVNETTSVNTSTLGSQTFTVYSKDAVGNQAVPSSITYNVGQATTTTTITSQSPNPSNIGQSVAIGFSVVGSTNIVMPTGTVTVTASTGENCAAPVSSGTCSITFTTSGSRTLTAKYSGDTNFVGSTSSAVTHTVNGATLMISPTSVNFGTPFIFTTSKQTITLTNTGSSTITLNSVVLSTADADDWSLSNQCGSSIGAGKSCTLTLSFTGDEVGTQTATITLTDNATNSPQQVGATVNVIAPAGLLTPIYASFGKVKVGSTATQKFVLTSVGLTSLTINNISISGTGFTQTNNCPSTLGVYASCTITVTFAPTAKVSYSGTLTVTDNGIIGKQAATFTGTGN